MFNIDDTLLDKNIQEIILDLRFERVLEKTNEDIWNHLVKTYHYLGYQKTIGPRLKYMIYLKERPVAAISFCQAALKTGARDNFIGWDEEQRKKNLSYVINNNRFLILPWVKVKNLASHILAESIKRLKKDWIKQYSKQPLLIETFVDKAKYKGTCYKASNWVYVGETKGFEKVGKEYKYHGNHKGVYLYILDKKYKKILEITEKPLQALKSQIYLEMVKMQLQTNDWHEGILESTKVSDFVNKLPEMLTDYLKDYQDCFNRKEQAANGNIYVKGLLSNLDRKSAEPIALEYSDNPKAPRNLQFFMKNAMWDDKKAWEIYQKNMSALLSEDNGMLTFDGSDFVKKGKSSVGVARQHCGAVGKTENCQAGVFAGYAGSKGYGLVDSKLFMPSKWFDDEHSVLRRDCNVPEDLKFKTKLQITLDMLNKIDESGLFKCKWIGVDSFFGNSKDFLDKIPEKYYYMADIHSDTKAWLEKPTFEVAAYKGKGPHPKKALPNTNPVSVSDIASNSDIPWEKKYIGEGSKGSIYADIKCIRIFRLFGDASDESNIKECWLFIRKLENGQPKYSVSNAPANISHCELCGAALMRWSIEQCFGEAKGFLGMDHYEFRSWTAWHRHMLFVFIAHGFLLTVRKNLTTSKKKPC